MGIILFHQRESQSPKQMSRLFLGRAGIIYWSNMFMTGMDMAWILHGFIPIGDLNCKTVFFWITVLGSSTVDMEFLV